MKPRAAPSLLRKRVLPPQGLALDLGTHIQVARLNPVYAEDFSLLTQGRCRRFYEREDGTVEVLQ